MTAELNPSPDENGDKELDFMLGTFDKDKRISQIATPVSDFFSTYISLYINYNPNHNSHWKTKKECHKAAFDVQLQVGGRCLAQCARLYLLACILVLWHVSDCDWPSEIVNIYIR